MAQITVTVPDAQAARVRDAFAVAYGWQPTIDGQPNPESKAQHAARRVREYVKDVVRSAEAQAAAEAARAAQAAAVESEITLT